MAGSPNNPGNRSRATGAQVKIMPAGRQNTLGLSERELSALLDQLEVMGAGKKNKNRKFSRWPFRRISVRIDVRHPGAAAESSNTVVCRNISRGGISVLHSAFWYPGSPCVVHLPTPDGPPVAVKASVVRCQHVHGVIHELGLSFDKPIDPRNHIKMNPFADAYSLENVEPEKLKGSVLHVEDSTAEQRIVMHFMRSTRVAVKQVSSVAEAVAQQFDRIDLILTDMHLIDGTAIDLLASLRAGGVNTPVIIATADQTALRPDQMQQFNVSALLAKPLSQDLLWRAIAEFLPQVDEKASPHAAHASSSSSAAPPPPPPRDVQKAFMADLSDCVQRLENSLAGNDFSACRGVCFQIKGCAPALGFGPLADLADRALTVLATPGNAPTEPAAADTQPAARKAIAGLLTACQTALKQVA